MSDQTTVAPGNALVPQADSAILTTALSSLQDTLFTAAEANIRSYLGEGISDYTELQLHAMVATEALRLTTGMDLSTIITRGTIIRKIETEGLQNVHPNGYANLTALAAENGVSVGELSDIRALCDVIFPYITEALHLNLVEVWEQVGKSKFREMVPALRSLITGENADHASVRGAVQQMLNEAAISLADIEECETSDVPQEEVRAHAVRTLLHEGAVRTTREMRRRVRPTPVPHVQAVTIQTGDGQYYGLMKFDTQEQLDLVLRILNTHIDNMRLDGRNMDQNRRRLFGSFFGGDE